MNVKRWTLGAASFLLASLAAQSQDLTRALEQTIRADVDLVQIEATVTDPRGRVVTGLSEEHFRVYEDRIEQVIENFSQEDVPISLGIILDVSGSMKKKLEIAGDAATTFLRTGNPQDEYFLVQFNDRPQITQGFTTDISRLQNQLIHTPSGGSTAVFDAVYRALEEVNDGINPKKALLLITDGEDNRSRYNFRSVREYVRESDVQIYAIGIVDGWNSQLAAGGSGRALIQDLAEETGGRAFFPNSVYELEDITTKISTELKNQYLIGYVSTNEATDGEWRNVKVEIEPPRGLPRLSLRYKKGYFARVR
jgi:Ca-activated chloride channel family protein